MKNYKWTSLGFGLAVSLAVVTIAFDLDLFERFALMLGKVEKLELDELVFPIILMIVFSLIDLLQYKKVKEMQEAREDIYKAMVQASDHVLKNCLNQMQLIKYTAEETPGFDPETLVNFDRIMEQAMRQIQALGEINEVNREAIGKSIDIKIFD